jgi:P4 family phage/plasmid primase-like protien
MDKEMETETDIGTRFENFLRSHRIPTGNPNKELITHVEMSTVKGSFKITGTEYEEFINLYYDFIVSGNEIGMIEKHNGKRVGPVICDFDIRTNNKNRAYALEHIETIIKTYNDIIKTIFNVDDNDLQAFVFEKDEPTKDIDKNGHFKGTYKDGFHVIWPYVPLFVEYRCMLYDICIKTFKQDKLFSDIDALEPLEKICDPSVIFSNGMMMFGSVKSGRNPYFLSTVYNYDLTTQNIKEYDPKSILNIHLLRTYDDEASLKLKDEERFINECYKCAKKYNYTELYIDKKFLADDDSTINETKPKKKVDDIKAILKDKNHQQFGRCTCCDEQITTPDADINIPYVKNLINCLSRKRCNDYQDWIRVGWALQNIWHGLLPDYIAFSKKSSKFVNGECEKVWKYAKEKGYGYALPSLIKWAKSDNPEFYLEISKELLSDLIKKASTNTDDDFANLIFEMYKTSYVCVDIKNNVWYEFQGHRWVNVPDAYTLSERISSEICEKILNGVRQSLVKNEEDNYDNDEVNKFAAKLRVTYSKLKSSNSKCAIIRACKGKFFNSKFLNLIDSNGKLVGFENGVYDLRNMEFRDGIPEDYITMTTGYKYIPYKRDDKIIRDIEKFFEKLQPEENVREYLLRFIAVCLDGSISLEQFVFWPGSGGNGKSKTLQLIKESFGEYQKPLPVKVLTGPTPDPQSPSPALADKRGVRFVHSSEPGKGEVLNISTMKLFTGGDEIAARNLFEKTFYFRPQFKMVFVLNDLVDIPSLDGGTWRRIVNLTFPSKFKSNPNPNKPYEFEKDNKLDEKIKTWKEPFMWYLLEVIMKRYQEDEAKKEGSGLKQPKRVISDTEDYHKRCDKYYEFINENCVKTDEDKSESITILYENYKMWFRSAYNMKPQNQSDFREYLVTNEYKVLQNKSVAGLILKENME